MSRDKKKVEKEKMRELILLIFDIFDILETIFIVQFCFEVFERI